MAFFVQSNGIAVLTKAVPGPHKRVARAATGAVITAALGAVAGAVAMNVDLPSAAMPWSVTQGFVLAAAVLALGMRAIRTRLEAVSLLLGWYLAATAALAPTWREFFGTEAGWVVWPALALVLSLPALLTPRKIPAVGAVAAIAFACVPPLGFLGLCNPMLVAGALFPATGWLGLALTLAFFALSASKAKVSVVLQVAALGWAMAHLALPAPTPPADSWAALTNNGEYPAVDKWAEGFKRQDAAKAMVAMNVSQGAKLLLLPETTNPLWDDGQAFYWKHVADQARDAGAQVLLGVYTNPMVDKNNRDALLNLTTGRLYPARITLPIAMWRPWSADSFPLQLDATDPIPTKYGPAAYLICYEELLMWPLPMQVLHERPALLLTAANQWFAHDWLGRPQVRASAMQARLWGLPLLRATNRPAITH